MTVEDAIKLLHPSTTAEALAEIECYGGFNGKQAKVEAVNTACLVACEALEKQIPAKPNYEREQTSPFGEDDIPYCPRCNRSLPEGVNYCEECGQRILWEGEE